MIERKVFCENCRNDVEVSINVKEFNSTLKGEKYSYTGKEAQCICCGSGVYVSEINDYNLKALYDAYREFNSIVSIDVIKAIPDKYDIGKRPLSIILGWGEQTFSRYFEGDVPSKQYSEILQKIYDDPRYYLEILENNKKLLKSSSSYEKSKNAVDALLGVNKNNQSKIDFVIEYLLNKCEDITPLALQKALYYIQGFYFAFNKSFIFADDCEAWIHGPVFRDIYFRYADYHFDPIKTVAEVKYFNFSASETVIIDSVIKNLCCYSGKVLEEFTHLENPWLETRNDLPSTAGSNKIISKDLIAEYFNAVKCKYNMINSNDIALYSSYMFKNL